MHRRLRLAIGVVVPVIMVVIMVVVMLGIVIVLVLALGAGLRFCQCRRQRELCRTGGRACSGGFESKEPGTIRQSLPRGFDLGPLVIIPWGTFEADQIPARRLQLQGQQGSIERTVEMCEPMDMGALAGAALVIVAIAMGLAMDTSRGSGRSEGEGKRAKAQGSGHGWFLAGDEEEAKCNLVTARTPARYDPRMRVERPVIQSGSMPVQRFLDRLGIAATSLCALHCVALTVVLWLYPLLWLRREVLGVPVGWLLWFELGLAAMGIAAAVLAFGAGWRTHRRYGPGLLFAAGAVSLAYGVYGSIHLVRYWGTVAVLLAGLLLVAGHLWNQWLSRSVGCPGVH